MAEAAQVVARTRRQWRDWLSTHHTSSPGVWLVTYKKNSGHPHLPYDAIVEESLCFGWVDSRSRALDELRSQLYVAPRKRGSNWSRANKERVERLVAAGLMAPAGAAVIAAAQADGSWSALDDVENLVEPDDLRRAIDAEPGARAHWDAFPRSTRRGILEWILNAKRAETRSARIRATAEQAGRGERANQWRRTSTADGAG